MKTDIVVLYFLIMTLAWIKFYLYRKILNFISLNNSRTFLSSLPLTSGLFSNLIKKGVKDKTFSLLNPISIMTFHILALFTAVMLFSYEPNYQNYLFSLPLLVIFINLFNTKMNESSFIQFFENIILLFIYFYVFSKLKSSSVFILFVYLFGILFSYFHLKNKKTDLAVSIINSNILVFLIFKVFNLDFGLQWTNFLMVELVSIFIYVIKLIWSQSRVTSSALLENGIVHALIFIILTSVIGGVF